MKGNRKFGTKLEFGYKTGSETRKQWVTVEMTREMDEGRKWENVSADIGVKNINNLILSYEGTQTRQERIVAWNNVRILMSWIVRVGQMYFTKG